MENFAKKILCRQAIFLVVLVFLVPLCTFGQNVTVKGKIVDTDKNPLIGVTVIQKGTTNGTVTNYDGDYSISVPSAATLVFSFIGLESQEQAVAGRSTIDIQMKSASIGVDEVVVVGFGTQKKVNLTGAVESVGAEVLESRPVQNAVQMLQGVVAGLNISTQGLGGSLDAGRNINVRGTGTIAGSSSGSPLVLIDGMDGDLNAVNPNDIENITVLKDAASAAVYGSRAPFGVILVTTKKGKEGKTQVNYNNNFSWSSPVQVPDMMNSYEFVNYWNDADFNGGGSGQKFKPEFVQRVKDYMDGKLDAADVVLPRADGKWDYDYTNANVDWMEQYYKESSPSQEHNLSINGGSDKWRYYMSANYLAKDGLMRYGQDTYDRSTVSAKISGQLNQYISLDFTNRFVRSNYDRATTMADGFYDHILRRARPIRAVTDPKGYYMSDINYIDALENGGRRNDQQDWNTHQVRMNIKPTKNWNIVAELNYRTYTQFVHEDAKKIYSRMSDGIGQYVALTSVANDYVYEFAKKSYFFNPNVYTDYAKSFGHHNLKVMAGFQFEQNSYREFSASRKDMITTELPVLNLTTNATPEIGGQFQEWANAGYFGRFNYDYNGKYLFEANMRYDGSSRYREDSRWNFFPSASLGWNISEEDFIKSNLTFVDRLKLRASYGKLGNQNTNDWYPTYSTLGTGTANGGWLVNGAKPNTASAPGIVSTSLTWEKIRSWNVGGDFALLRNRLTGSADYFVRFTEEGMGDGPSLPAVLGTGVPKVNNVDIKTTGFEITVGWRDRVKDFAYGVRANLSDSRTKVISYPNETQNIDKYLEGYYTGEIWGYKTIGIAKTDEEMNAHLATLTEGGQSALGSRWAAGDIMYEDTNNDKKISQGALTVADHGDLSVIGNNTPRYALGLDLDASWKGFDFRMFWQGILKRDWYPTGMVFWGATGAGEWWSTALTDHVDYFRASADHPLGQNLDSYYPRPLFGDKNQKTQTRYLLDASYMRMKNIQIGYTIPASVSQRVKISKLRIFASGENLITLTKLNNTLDPESIGIGRQGGTVYPLSKVYSFGLSATF
jgi:TonB-linked SusC/RagA family outer membrane protein